MDHVTSSEQDPAGPAVATTTCSCALAEPSQWRKRDTLDSPASVVAGVLVIAFGVTAVIADKVPMVGWVVLGMLVGLTMLGTVTSFQRGHRGGCLLGRSLWTGVAWLGLPLRAAAALPF